MINKTLIMGGIVSTGWDGNGGLFDKVPVHAQTWSGVLPMRSLSLIRTVLIATIGDWR